MSMTSEQVATRAQGRIEARMASDRRPPQWIKDKPPALQAAVAKRVSAQYNAAKAATKTRVAEGMQATTRMYDKIKTESYVAGKLAERAKAAAPVVKAAVAKAAPVVEAVSKSAPVAKFARPVLGALARRAPIVGTALDVATTGAAIYQGAKASEAHSDLTHTAKSLEKRGIAVETPSFNPLKAGFPGVFGEHPEVKVKEKNSMQTTARKKGKLGS